MWTSVWLGNLVVNPVYEAGGYMDYNPLYYPREAEEENQAKQNCCLYSNSCPAYYNIRPIKTCTDFVPPRIGNRVSL